MRAVREELIRPGVAVVIEDLVTREASGVLEIEGNPSGRVYLDGGHIVYARASWVPSLAARLGVMAPSLVSEDAPRSRDDNDAAVAELAVRRGYLTATGLGELIRSIVVDVFLVLTIPVAEDSSVTAIRFTWAPTCWTGLFPRLGADEVRAAALGQAEEMAGYGPDRTSAVARRCLGGLARAGLCVPVPTGGRGL